MFVYNYLILEKEFIAVNTNKLKICICRDVVMKYIRNKLGVHDYIIVHIKKRFNLPRRRHEYHTLYFMW